jgi:hypothetical protein
MTNLYKPKGRTDRPESSRARCRDDKDDEDGDDDDMNDPTYDQDELMGSHLTDAPQGTQTQVHVLSNKIIRLGASPRDTFERSCEN